MPIAAGMNGSLPPRSGHPKTGRDLFDTVQLRRWLRVLFPIRSSPRRIALGVSIGVLIAFSPTIGFQMGLALVVASMFNASRVAAVTCVWVSNPLTMGPVFAFTYAVGRPFWFTSPDVGLAQLSRAISGGHSPTSIGAVFNAFHSIYSLGTGMYLPMLVGGLIVGVVVGGACYLPAKSIASHCQKILRRRSRASRRGPSRGSKPLTPRGAEPAADMRSDAPRASSQRKAA